jgi:hypothetical protein
MELTLPIISLICKYDLPNFIFIIPGFLNFNLKNAQLKTRATWILSTSALWLEVFPHLLIEKLNPFIKKQKYVEVMYGLPRRHRTYVADWILKNNLSDYIIQTPFFLNKTNNIPNQIYNLDNSLMWENEIIPNSTHDNECQYNGVDMLLSQVVPFKIYQQTAFSLICETGFDNSYTFFTEKITKPMLGCRLFVVVSGQFYLKNLKLLGFKTFDGIIDESYDLESNPETRWSMAMEQVKWLCQQDQIEILKSIVPIVLHNQDLLLRLSTNQLSHTIESLLLREELKSL